MRDTLLRRMMVALVTAVRPPSVLARLGISSVNSMGRILEQEPRELQLRPVPRHRRRVRLLIARLCTNNVVEKDGAGPNAALKGPVSLATTGTRNACSQAV